MREYIFNMHKFIKFLIPLLVLLFMLGPVTAPEARAMDPVTIAILAPLAVKGAKIAAPYVVRGLICGSKQMGKIGFDAAKILFLPIGLIQMTLGAPFGQFSNGVNHCWHGILSPFKMVWDTIMLPMAFTGIDPPG